MPQEWLFLIVVGLVAGVFSGMFGIGGGVVIVPALAVFLGFSTREAIAASLAALLMPVGILAVNAYYRANLLDIRASALVALGLLVTSALGARIAEALDLTSPALLRQVYGVFLIVMGWRFAEPRLWWAQIRTANRIAQPPPSPTAPAATPPDELQLQGQWWGLLVLGLIAGIFSGLFGIGGGAVIVPALVGFLNYDQKRAVGTSLGALLLPVGLPGVLDYYRQGVLNVPVGLMIALGLLIGAVIGARTALRLPSATVKRLYGVFLFFVAFYFIFQDALFALLNAA